MPPPDTCSAVRRMTRRFRALTVYSEVLEHIQRDYVDDPNMHAVTNGSLHGLLDSLDPQSAYLSPLEYKDFKEKSASNPPAETGLALTRRFGYIGVIGVLPDSPGRENRPAHRRHSREDRRLHDWPDGH